MLTSTGWKVDGGMKEMRFENVREIRVKATNGKVELEGWNEGHAEVDYTVHGEVDVIVEQNGGTLIVEERPRRKFRLFGAKEGWAEIKVRVPKEAVVRAKSVNGELKAENIRFTEVTTVNGEITLRNCEAELIKTVNGEICAHLTVAGPLKASTVNGDLEVTIEELEGDVEVSCVNGDVRLRLTDFCDARITTKTAHGDVELVGINPGNPVIGTGEYEVRVSTLNGDVRVERV